MTRQAPPQVVHVPARDLIPGLHTVVHLGYAWLVGEVEVTDGWVQLKVGRLDEHQLVVSDVMVVGVDVRVPRLRLLGEDVEPDYRPIGEDQIDGEDEAGIKVFAHWSDVDDAAVIQIDVDKDAPRTRVYVNDATLYDGQPHTEGVLGPEHVQVLLDLIRYEDWTDRPDPRPGRRDDTREGWFVVRAEAAAVLERMKDRYSS